MPYCDESNLDRRENDFFERIPTAAGIASDFAVGRGRAAHPANGQRAGVLRARAHTEVRPLPPWHAAPAVCRSQKGHHRNSSGSSMCVSSFTDPSRHRYNTGRCPAKRDQPDSCTSIITLGSFEIAVLCLSIGSTTVE
jgi:hypothetical protein